jgi:hypothetical protein
MMRHAYHMHTTTSINNMRACPLAAWWLMFALPRHVGAGVWLQIDRLTKAVIIHCCDRRRYFLEKGIIVTDQRQP